MKAKDLYETGENLFSKRSTLMSLWQEVGEQFYPERADFTYQRTVGTDFASGSMTSYPFLCRRDLADQTGQMLRPTAKQWFHVAPMDVGRENNDAKRWLEWSTATMRRAMYDRKALFTKASKEADNDYAAFGNCVTSAELNRSRDRLLYRCWHLRDVAWFENEEGQIGGVFRKWKAKARDLTRIFGASKLHDKVNRLMTTNKPLEEVQCMHMVVEADFYDENAKGRPYWSIYYDCDNHHVIESVPQWSKYYNVARWQTVSGSQYGFSPAVTAALPEARLLQSMTYTLLEAGEKATNPPMIATQDVVRSDMALYAGGVTWIDRDYDEKLGEALRALNLDFKGMPLGLDLQQRSQTILVACFYLNKLTLPQRAPEMTAYEVGQRIQEYIRNALPIFEPMEMERNGGDCELTFDLMLRAGGFGSPFDMPDSLQGAELQFRFESPLHDAIGAQKGQKLFEMRDLIAATVTLDPEAAAIPDAITALRDAMDGAGIPARWVRNEVSFAQVQAAMRQAQEAQQALGAMQQAADVSKNLAAAQKDRALVAA